MAGARRGSLLPSPAFAAVPLEIETLSAGRRFGRLYLDRYPDPLGYGKGPSRFSDPRRRAPARRFGVLYLGDTLKVCFLEGLLRDQRDGHIGDLPIAEADLRARRYADVQLSDPLRVVDLRGDRAVRMGIPSDVARATRQTLARAWSVAFYTHPEHPDGILYPSRLNGETNVAVYDRAVAKLTTVRARRLLAVPEIGDVLTELRVALV